MQDQNALEDQVLRGIREYAESINAGRAIVSDTSILEEATNNVPLTRLNHWERLIRHEFDQALSKSTKANWKFWQKPSVILTWIDLISWDGHNREKTLRALTNGAPNGFFFALAIRRLNDWVPQVRQAARETLPFLAKQSKPDDIASAILATLPSFIYWGRMKEEDRHTLFEIIQIPEVSAQLKNKIVTSSTGPMSFMMSQIGRIPVLDEYFYDIAQTAQQPSVRAKAYRQLFEQRVVWLEGRRFEWTDIRYCKGKVKPITGERKVEVTVLFLKLLSSSAIDNSSIVRRVAAEFLIKDIENLGDLGQKLANTFAADKSKAVAGRGQFALKKLQELS